MTAIPYIGLTGVAGAGKDTVFERMVGLGGESFVRLSVADPLKESVAALFNCTLEELDVAKRRPMSVVMIKDMHTGQIGRMISMREFLQRYGTEAHRDVFGQDFWLDTWVERATQLRHDTGIKLGIRASNITIVNTSVRFENEARRIIDLGGEVWQVDGPQDEGAGGHASEQPLDDSFIAHVIDNSYREVFDGMPNFSYLDEQITDLIYGSL